jgi:hypothetical protein
MAAVLQLIGGHWAVLQATAWVGMVIEYSSSFGVQAGLAKTFDGQHPCELCRRIAHHTGAEKKHAASIEYGKFSSIAQANGMALHPPMRFWHQQLSECLVYGVSRPPLVPPPRDPIV